MSDKTKIMLAFVLIILFVFIVMSWSSRKRNGNGDRDMGTLASSVSFNYLPAITSGEIIYHTYYTLAYSEENEQAIWVAYKITTDNFNSTVKRHDEFRIDPQVANGSAELSDYSNSGYDRGHLAPAGSMKINTTSMSESFYMSNMSPQIPGFNGGVWEKLEEEVRSITRRSDSVFVVTGPVLNHPIEFIGENKVAVPEAYFKTLLVYKNGSPSGIAFLLPHQVSSADVYSFSTSIDHIEEITGIDFYFKLQNQSDFESTSMLNGY